VKIKMPYNPSMQSSTIEDKRPYTSQMKCPKCAASIEYWHTSGMSDCYPHFYCDTCSNVLWRKQDYETIRPDHVDVGRVLSQIIASLPKCKCGGHFTLDAGPKCPTCGYEFKQQVANAELRATQPHDVLIQGAERLTEP
jgi:hypothetical protein